MKFIASYSGGKDSALAIHRAVKEKHELMAILTTYNSEMDKSNFHHLPENILRNVAASFRVPLILVRTAYDDYLQKFEEALLHAKAKGAEACVFGDIDIEEHRRWCSERCENTGMLPLFPLWGESRKSIVYEFIDSGFIADIAIVNRKYMAAEYLGRRLTRDTANDIEGQGIDICGENGEYHTFVSAGPLFTPPVDFSFGEMIVEGNYAILPLQAVCPAV